MSVNNPAEVVNLITFTMPEFGLYMGKIYIVMYNKIIKIIFLLFYY